MNVDENQQIPAEFGVRSIPFLLIFKNGEVVAQQVGAQNLPAFLEHLS
ncbi:thioredoxin domain protein [Glaesserella parasuis 84-15995]|nr:thioredoxin domain protein [Glaesserella parasuis 84-15995]EQA13251.1 thioredoxin family protein [Glaesserella parasuis SW140]